MPATLRPELTHPMPERMRRLPLDARGYPVPWFVDWIDGVPEFRAMDPHKWRLAVRDRRCWVCGEPLGQYLAFVLGPMCGVNRTSSEPPNHLECAEWSARNCPFLSRPHMVRREDDTINDALAANVPGFALTRNPGVALVWITKSYRIYQAHAGGTGYLLELGEPLKTWWYCAGRPATRAEVDASIAGGLPALDATCDRDRDPAVARRELARAVERLAPWLPKH